MRSSLYFGEVRHHRRSPKKHDLRYKLYMPHLFLDEVNEVFKDRWLWSVDRSNLSSFQRKDYHAPKTQPRGRGQGNHFRTNRLRGQRPGFGTHSPPDFRSLLQSRDFLLRLGPPKDPTQCPPGRDHQHPVGRATPKPSVGLTRIRTVPPSRSTDSKKNSTYLPSSG